MLTLRTFISGSTSRDVRGISPLTAGSDEVRSRSASDSKDTRECRSSVSPFDE